MRFLIIKTDYPDFLRWFYESHPGLDRADYSAQLEARESTLFDFSSAYGHALARIGHQAVVAYCNNEPMQRAWERSHVAAFSGAGAPPRPLMGGLRKRAERSCLRHLRPAFGPILRRIWPPDDWQERILKAQICHYEPDVVLNLAMEAVSGDFLKDSKTHYGILAGQSAAPLDFTDDLRNYDLLLSSLPNYVERFREYGVASEYLPLGFDMRALAAVREERRPIAVSFVGSLFSSHSERRELLEHLCRNTEIQVWGHHLDRLPRDSAVRRRFQGQVWGPEMYQVLRDSRITINSHISIAGPYANNMRLYEATGMGALLLTDAKENLADLFDPGREVVAYHSPEECVELIRHYLTHETERQSIADRGRRRTIEQYGYEYRMQDLVRIMQQTGRRQP